MNTFKAEFLQDLKERWILGTSLTPEMIRISLVNVIKKKYVVDNWINSKQNTDRRVHYFSMEFMVGKQLKTNLVNLDKLDEVTDTLFELGININEIFKNEIESKTANGGLGRLAFAIMNGLSNKGVNATGNTLLYNHGIFEQHIINGKQVEMFRVIDSEQGAMLM